jgi:hypothetical protein
MNPSPNTVTTLKNDYCVCLEESESSNTDSTKETKGLSTRDVTGSVDNDIGLSRLRLFGLATTRLDGLGGLLGFGRLGGFGRLHGRSESGSRRASCRGDEVALVVVGVVADTASKLCSAGSLVGIGCDTAVITSLLALGETVIGRDGRSNLSASGRRHWGSGHIGCRRGRRRWGDRVSGSWVDRRSESDHRVGGRGVGELSNA